MFAEKVWPLTLGEKAAADFRRQLSACSLALHDERLGGWRGARIQRHFNKYITSRGLQKQEGVIFRHLLRMILLVKEFEQFAAADCPADEWQAEMRDIQRLTEICRQVDATSTDKTLEEAEQGNF